MLSLLLFANTLLLSLRLSNGGSFPKPLTASEERFWLERRAKGDPEARNVLIERNLRLVAHIVKKYYTQSGEQEDLISIGTIGLIKAISTFKPEKGVRLATYAARCIENEILMYFRAQRKLQNEVSLSDAIDADGQEDSLQLLDVVGVADTMLEDLHDRDNVLRVRRLVRERLTEREAEVIRLRYGLDGSLPLTQREVAAKFGISRSYVSRIEKKALNSLRAGLES
ncbi:MAG: RNA polymerase sporulation sigma factor SigK [Oscillibacter sp.]|nr:RNA polymerase sporulation sigma factor SigK [Oscillibacter sp.]MBQ9618442.1 RNA polymerase sporulation sigma factor SigK [Oscillibacter sp.]